LSEEARIQEEEDADELYRDVNINQGRILQVTQNVEDTHVTLTSVNPNEEPVQTTCQMEETLHPVFETGADDQPIFQTSQHPEWFSQPRRPPSPDRAWNTTLPAS
nr:hypothetical protein [Tanacetum cinerariifolium]